MEIDCSDRENSMPTMSDTQLRVIVSDLGKVLLPFDVQRVWAALQPHFSVEEAEARLAVRTLLRETRFGCGEITGSRFHELLCERTGLCLAFDAFCEAWSDMFWEDGGVLNLIIRAPVERRYLLSNTNDIHWAFICSRYSHVLDGFDRLLVSHELGLEKPDPAIYRWVCDDTGLPPSAHLFIDDIEENVTAARGVGMDGILHTDSRSLWREFVARGLASDLEPPAQVHTVLSTPAAEALWVTPSP
jgi:glucose-1-phosphatase